MRELNSQEIKTVSGSFGPPGAAFGGFVAGAGYLGSAATSGSFSWSGFGWTVAGGAVAGFIGGPVASAAVRYALPRVAFASGAASGIGNGGGGGGGSRSSSGSAALEDDRGC